MSAELAGANTPPHAEGGGGASTRSSRARRKTAKQVDYSKEQEFSDDDVFEDNAETPAPPRRSGGGSGGGAGGGAKSAGSSRRKPRASRGADNDDDDDDVDMMDISAGAPVATPSKFQYVEKGYDPTLPPIRERFTFMPEFEADGSPKIELIVGRRPLNGTGAAGAASNEPIDNPKQSGISNDDSDDDDDDNDDNEEDEDEDAEDTSKRRGRAKKVTPKKNAKGKRKTRGKKKGGADGDGSEGGANGALGSGKPVEYEYLLKYKGKSYLHLEWKTAQDLEGMNKAAKSMYRRFLKKLAAGTEEDLEDPSFDPSYIEPQKVVDEEEQEVMVELSDKELIEWEKERQRELDEESSEGEDEDGKGKGSIVANGDNSKDDKDGSKEKESDETKENEIDEELGNPGTLTIEQIRKILNKDGPYYPTYENSDNPYRDGYITEPPKKPRASYLFFQCCYRSEFQRRHDGATQGEIMTILGDTWRAMSEDEQAPFIQLAREEALQYEKECTLLEKAQRPNELWQPLRRCRQVLDRLANDSFASIFLEPVDTNEFPDYEDIVDQPMDLGTVREKLEKKKYQAPENFARDMRKIWHNCKVYNQHGSAIWQVADYMSKQFERLYHAWVLEFRDRYLRWANPKARPWENSCRHHDGKCNVSDEKSVLCDHCDAVYGMACIKLKKLPDGVWHCPECSKHVNTNKDIRIQSSLAEQAARKRAELGDIPKKKVLKKMYLVKWAGLGYEHCTWETKEDLNDDLLIEEFHRLNNMVPDEPELTEAEIKTLLEETAHITEANAGGGSTIIPTLREQLYALVRAFQFSKFGHTVPSRLGVHCGPQTAASHCDGGLAADLPLQMSTDAEGSGVPTKPNHPREVVECVYDMIARVTRGETMQALQFQPPLPPLLTGEYDAVVPITSKGLMMNVGEIHGSVAFLGYRQFPDGSKGPSELANLIRNVGDKIIAVDGVSTVNKSFKEVILMLRESGKNMFAYMRFLTTKYNVCNSEYTSMGVTGKYASEELKKKFTAERRRLVLKRRLENRDDEKEDEPEKEKNDGDGDDGSAIDSDADASEGDFDSDSEDGGDVVAEHNIVQQLKSDEAKEGEGETDEASAPAMNHKSQAQTAEPKDKAAVSTEGDVRLRQDASSDVVDNKDPMSTAGDSLSEAPAQTGGTLVPSGATNSVTPDTSGPLAVDAVRVQRQEATRSLARRILDVDVGYSSDEGGDEDCAFFTDGVDSTFTTEFQVDDDLGRKGEQEIKTAAQSERSNAAPENVQSIGVTSRKVPAKKNDFATLGDRAKLCACISLTGQDVDADDFDNYPSPSTKQMQKAEEEEREREAKREAEEKAALAEQEPVKLSKTKVEQVSTSTNEVVRVWVSAEDAAATLQIPLKEIKQILKGEYNEEIGDEVGGYRWRFAAEDAVVSQSAGGPRGGSKVKAAILDEFRDKLYDPRTPHVYKGGNRLRDYQVDGVNWLASCWYKRHGCILADEMGLGKTVQIVTFIEHIYRVEKIQRPYLVVVPLSTVEHWRREFEGWTDMQCCVYHDRQRVWRDVMREYEWYYADRPHTPEYLKFDVLVTTYDTLIGDFDVVGQIPWRVTVVDEAHRLRNVKGKLLECMKETSAKGTLQYGFQGRVLMTGTPLQNNTQELWTLLNFIEPYKFPSLEEFEMNFGNMANKEQVEALQRKISPFMLRRVKEDVAKDIPAKEETLIDVELTSIQKQYYRAIFEHNHSFLTMGATRATAPKLMNIQMELRKCCNHPFLLDGIESREMEKYQRELLESGELDDKTPEAQQALINEHGYVHSSGKMVLLDKLLPKLRQEGHKVLVFSQMVKMLDLISEYCDFRGFRHERLDGRVRGNERQKSIDRFETEKDSFLFLLSTRAGGVGINLTAADVCIIFDSDWNPQNDVQAQARCHRIGQTKDVMIYRLITSRTFEQEMFDRASKKLGLEQAVLGTFGQDESDGKPSSKEMEQLLKKGAYSLLEDENDEIGKEFCSDDIESILAKRTRTRVVEGNKTASWLNKSGLVVSKSKFTGDSAAATAGIDVDDPLFWQKVMPDFVTPTIMMTKLNDLSKLVDKPPRGSGPGDRSKENGDDDAGSDEEKVSSPNAKDAGLTRTRQKKVNKFMSDLKSMMDGIFEEDEDGSLPQTEKTACHKLLLTVSVKNKLFSEEQRSMAKSMLKRLEGDRRRRCRTPGDEPSRFSSIGSSEERDGAPIRKELLITGKIKRRKKHQKEKEQDVDDDVEAPSEKKRRRVSQDKDEGEDKKGYIGEDGYLHHTDSEADWSDVGEGVYDPNTKRNRISRKEARRRRAWASEKDAAAAAGQEWPSLPRHMVNKVLGTLLDEVIKHDKEKGGLFSVPVPKDTFPEYYDVVKNPMDYGTMKQKLAKGEYRSARAMQRDFVLVMSNCLQFNSANSDIVREARQQALTRPTLLKKAAMAHNLFLAEDGSVLEVFSDAEDDYKDSGDTKESGAIEKKKRVPKKKPSDSNGSGKVTKVIKTRKLVRCGECEGCKRKDCGKCIPCKDKLKFGGTGKLKQSCVHRICATWKNYNLAAKKKSGASEEADNDGGGEEKKKGRPSSPKPSEKSTPPRKPRIRISLPLNGAGSKKKQPANGSQSENTIPRKRNQKRKRSTDDDDAEEGEEDDDHMEVDQPNTKSSADNSSDDRIPKRKKRLPLAAAKAERQKGETEGDENRASTLRKRKGKKVPPAADADREKAKKGPVRDPDPRASTRKAAPDTDTESESEGEVKESEGEVNEGKKGKTKTPPPEASSDADIYLNAALLKVEHEALDGTFPTARDWYKRRGPWKLPKSVGEDSFQDVAKLTLSRMMRHDSYSLFAEEVTDEQAPGYSAVVKKPMDFGTMRTKLDGGSYSEGSAGIKQMYGDFLLVMENCALYNDEDGEVLEEAARLCGLLPLAFSSACIAVAGKKRTRKRKTTS